jgi:hypothetical protein
MPPIQAVGQILDPIEGVGLLAFLLGIDAPFGCLYLSL